MSEVCEVDPGETLFAVRADHENRSIPIGFATLFYSLLGLAGWVWLNLSQPVILRRLWSPESAVRDVAVGLGVGFGVVLISLLAGRTLQWADEMEDEFSEILSKQPKWTLPLLALLSGVGEELFFRGALQAHVGVWIQAVVFGLAHIPYRKRMWAWPIFAGVIGLLFGWLTIWTGTIWAAVVAHAAINGINLWRIVVRPSSTEAPPNDEPPTTKEENEEESPVQLEI